MMDWHLSNTHSSRECLISAKQWQVCEMRLSAYKHTQEYVMLDRLFHIFPSLP